MELSKIIGYNLNILRTERNLSLGQLSEVAGISKAMLSDIEKGNGNPTINTIWKIANGLKVSYTRLIDGIDDKAIVIRKEAIPVQTGDSTAYRVQCYYPTTPTRNFELFYAELDANSSNNSIGHSEKAQEYVYVTKGELTLITENQEYTLNEGDSITFDASITHTYMNKQDIQNSFIVINFYLNV